MPNITSREQLARLAELAATTERIIQREIASSKNAHTLCKKWKTPSIPNAVAAEAKARALAIMDNDSTLDFSEH